MFDPPERVRWARTPFAVLDQPAHRELARQVARESMVLLKNDRGTLPLRKDLGTLAVIGPNADQWRMLLGNYNGIPKDPVTPLRGIREAVSRSTRVLYARGADLAEGFPVMEVVPSTVLASPEGRPGLRAEYFAGRAMSGAPAFAAPDTTLDVNWAESSPRQGLDKDDFAVRRNEVDLTIGSRETYAQIGYIRLNRNIAESVEDLRDKEELRLAGRVKFARYWSVFGATVLDLTDREEDPLSEAHGFEPVRNRLGVAYEDDCLVLGVTWRRDYERLGEFRAGSTFALQIALKGLGR